MLDLSPNDPIIKIYLKDIQHLESQQVKHELGLRGPFQNLLDKAAKKRGWTLVPELSTYSGGCRVVPDCTVRDEFRLAPLSPSSVSVILTAQSPKKTSSTTSTPSCITLATANATPKI